MTAVPTVDPPRAHGIGSSTLSTVATCVLAVIQLAMLVILALDPVGRIYVAPVLVVFVIGACATLWNTPAIVRELVALARNRGTRVIHGLEHACIAILRERGVDVRSGLTGRGELMVELANDGRALKGTVLDATEEAIRRIRAGERRLAYSPSCGTSIVVALWLLSCVIVGGAIVGIVVDAPAQLIIAAIVAAVVMAALASRPLGLLAQRLLTVSTRFVDARVRIVAHEVDGERAAFVVTVTLLDQIRVPSAVGDRSATSAAGETRAIDPPSPQRPTPQPRKPMFTPRALDGRFDVSDSL